MKVSIIVTTDDGKTFQGVAELSGREPSKSAPLKKPKAQKVTPVAAHVNLSSPVRPFMKKHSKGMGGPQKFALLLAHIAKGDAKKEVGVAEIQKQWGKMKGILGDWNPAYATRAKDQEWVDAPKYATYTILPSWKGVFNGR